MASSQPVLSINTSAIGTIEANLAQPPSACSPRQTVDTKANLQNVLPAPKDLLSDLPASLSEECWYPDGGLRAWICVAGCFLMASTCMGWGLAWGVLQDYYHTQLFPTVPLNVLSLVIGINNFLSTGTSYMAGALGDRFGFKKLIAISSFFAYLCLLASAFATKLSHLFLFQAGFFGLSQGLSMPLYMALPSQWFLKRRGFATGLAVSGSGIGGAIEALYLRPLIVNLGYRKTMLIYSSIHAVVWIIAWFMLKERPLPPSLRNATKRWLPRKVNGQFYSIALTVLVGVFGYLPPFNLISTYTRAMVPSIPPDSLLVVIPLVVMAFSSGIGRILAGIICDRVGPMNCFFFSFFFGGIMQLAGWSLAKSFSSIIVFSALYGLVGAWFLSLLPVVCAELFSVEGLSTVTGFMVLANSPGQFVGPTIASSVLSSTGNNWVIVSTYSGGIMILGSLCSLYARFSFEKRIWAAV